MRRAATIRLLMVVYLTNVHVAMTAGLVGDFLNSWRISGKYRKHDLVCQSGQCWH